MCLVRGGQYVRLASNKLLFIKHKFVNEEQKVTLIGVSASYVDDFKDTYFERASTLLLSFDTLVMPLVESNIRRMVT